MPVVMTGRERQHDIYIDGEGYVVVEDEKGVPLWRSDPVPRIAGETAQIAEERREHRSWHSGFGYARALAPNTYHYCSGGIDASRPRQIIMGPLVTTMAALGNVTDFVELGSVLYVAASRYLQKVDTSGDTCVTPDVADYTTGFDFTAGKAISVMTAWDSVIFILFSTATNAYTYDGTNNAPTQLNTNSIRGVYSAKFWSESANAYVLARTYTASGDPAVAWIAQGAALDSTNWTAAYDVGDDTKAITGLAGGKTMVWVGKRDGLYYIDGRSGRTPRVIEALPVDDNNGENLFVDATGQVWYPSAGGLYRYNPNTGVVWDVTPGRGLQNQSPIYGNRWSVVQYKGWYYASVYNGTDSYILVGREREEDEPGIGPIIWHGALVKVASAQITCMYVCGLTSPPRLYFGYGSTVAYFRLPDKADNPIQSSTYRHAASGSIYFSAENMGTVGSRYSLAGIVVQCKGMSVSTYADIFARIDNGEWQLINRLQASGRVFIPLPSGDWRFSDLELRFDITNASSTSTPEIWGVTVLATQRVYTRPLIQTSVWCSQRVLSDMGIRERRSGLEIVDALDNLSVQGPVLLTDFFTGNKRDTQVLVQPVRLRLARYKGEDGKWTEWAEVADVTLVAQSSEVVQIDTTTTVHKWNSGRTWGDGAKWG